MTTDARTAEAHAAVDYRTYWLAWACLLVITLAMVLTGAVPILITGMAVKALIIALWFMHLRYERLDLVLCVLLGIFFTALLLFLLIYPDGQAM